ncbi:hypothetical protein LLG46_00040 [bacterium]|nr:hypothetical protein [bacterium]
MESAWIGIIGVVIGLVINEFFRRSSRVEPYSQQLFAKRIEVYEDLFRITNNFSKVAAEVLENDDYTPEERKEIVDETVLAVAELCDQQAFYLDDRIVIQCVSALMGLEDIYYITDSNEKTHRTKQFYDNLTQTRQILKDCSGLSKIEELFQNIHGYRLDSEIIRFVNKQLKGRKPMFIGCTGKRSKLNGSASPDAGHDSVVTESRYPKSNKQQM